LVLIAGAMMVPTDDHQFSGAHGAVAAGVALAAEKSAGSSAGPGYWKAHRQGAATPRCCRAE